MDGNRQGLDARRRGPSADEVKNLRASREELAVALTMERDLHRAWRGLSFILSRTRRTTGYACGMEGSLLSTFASIHDVDEN